MKKALLPFLAAILIWGCVSDRQKQEQQQQVFLHGVASGDPLSDRVIIWSRVTPHDSSEMIEVQWEISSDREFESILKYGKYTTSPDRDYTVKIDVDRLNPGTTYYYRFKALEQTSMVGRTKTASLYADSLSFAVVSCSHYERGFFNAYGRIAEREDLDAVLHLGDYIYEYGAGSPENTVGRFHEPDKEIITLQDYRTRYAQYRTDEDLIAVHANHPFITTWDDHEVANNSYKTGAQNHQEDEGSYEVRKAVARQVYYEWLPIREGDKLYREFSFGKLAEILMLDERLEGRSEQLSSIEDPMYQSPERSMLGKTQLEWLKDNLSTSEATWKIIGNQVIFTDLSLELVFPNRPRNMDSWDGYPAEKREIARSIIENDVENVIWVTGDTHSSWVFETVVEGTGEEPFAVEFGTTSVSSTNYDERTTIDTVRMVEGLFQKSNPHLKYTNLADHGYVLLTVTPVEAKAHYFFVDTVLEPSDSEKMAYQALVKSGTPKIISSSQ